MFIPIRNYDTFIQKMQIRFAVDENFIIILVDIDNFHTFNKQLDNDSKIEKLKKFFMEKIPFESFYLGKDEFGFICGNESFENVISQLVIVKKEFEVFFNTTISIGVAKTPQHGEDYVEIIRNLEESLYQAKKLGKNRICIADSVKMRLKSNYYTPIQLQRLSLLSKHLNRSEASLLRESLDEVIRKYET